jgi:uncharacterized SAM-dependent methyltransferase
MRYRVDVYTDEQRQQRHLEEDVRRGLTARPKSLPPKYFYDRAGSLLFERITELPEYYPTRTESALLEEILPGLLGEFLPDDLVESGSGTSEKTRRVLNGLSAGGRPVRYVPLDVDRLTLEATAERLLREYPSVSVHAVVGDFEPEAFRHVAFYNESAARIEMHLVAESAQAVRLRRLGLTIRFRRGEAIWTESSYKFTRPGVESLLDVAGLRLDRWHVDPANYFALALIRPA